MMNKMYLLVGIIGVVAVLTIAVVVVYQFIQQQSDRQAAIKADLKEEFDINYSKFLVEADGTCYIHGNPTKDKDKCIENLHDKYGIYDEKYSDVATDVMIEGADKLIELGETGYYNYLLDKIK